MSIDNPYTETFL